MTAIPLQLRRPMPVAAGRQVVLEARVVTGSGGGPEKTILKSPPYLVAAGYRTVCAYLHPPGDPGFDDIRWRANKYGAHLVPIPDHGPLDWKLLPRLLDLCRREKVTIWHGHDYKSNAIGLVLRRFWPMRLVSTVHGWVQHTRRTPLYYGVDRFCLRRYEAVICVSHDLHRQCLRAGVRRKRCWLIENAIDTDEYVRSLCVANAKARLGVPDDRLLVGAVGRLSPEKGFDVLIRAVDRLLHEGVNVELQIFGDGDDRGRLQDLIAALGREDHIRLMGYRLDLGTIYQALDVFALSSYREGLPNVVLEAMAMQVPVVVSEVAGLPRLVRDGRNGLLVPPGDIERLTQALRVLLHDPQARRTLGQQGRATIVTDYSFSHRMERIREIYDYLVRTG